MSCSLTKRWYALCKAPAVGDVSTVMFGVCSCAFLLCASPSGMRTITQALLSLCI